MTSSPHGSGTWIGQRLSALVLIPLGVWFLLEILSHVHADYATMIPWIAQSWVSTSLAMMIGILFYHSAVGLQVIIEDYIPNPKKFILIIKLFNLALTLLGWFFIFQISGKG